MKKILIVHCKGKVVSSPTGTLVHFGSNGKPIEKSVKMEQKAMHPSLTAFVPKCEKLEPTCEKSMHGSALIHEGPVKAAKIIHKVGSETLEAGKALLGIKGK
jgi:hypothetical protein